MKFDLNVAIRDGLDFLQTYFRPQLAKYIIVPLMPAGIYLINPPIWTEIVNSIISWLDIFPGFELPVGQPSPILGWTFLAISFSVFIIELLVNRRLPAQLKELPLEVAREVTDNLKSSGFTAQHLQDERIEERTREISMLRHFSSFPKVDRAVALADSIINGELSGGTSKVKARSLALLARFLCVEEGKERANDWLVASIKLCPTEESKIAKAFIDAIGSGNIYAASGLLEFGSPLNHAAFFMIKRNLQGSEAALTWLKSAGLSAQDLDSDGKFSLVSTLLSEHKWQEALTVVKLIDDKNLNESLILTQLAAYTFLTNSIKAIELRENVINYIPLPARTFPLADDADSIFLRNRSVELFKSCSRLANQYGAKDVACLADQYVLWLELRNSETHEQAKSKLQGYFIGYNQEALEYLPLAFAFDVEIDLESIESEINRRSALCFDSDIAIGLARFILAQSKCSLPEMIDYIVRHRNQMEKAVNESAIKMLEIEALARSGLVDDAERLLKSMTVSGELEDEVNVLKNIIGAFRGKDPVALAISQYQKSNSISDLSHLISLLEKGGLRDKSYSYCQELFERTGQESDAIRVCNAASLLGLTSDLYQFLINKMDIVKRSEGLQAHWAWSLFRMGDLNGAKEQVALLAQSTRQQPDLKTLEIYLSIYGGDWESLSIFVESSWNGREELRADDLLQAAQLAKAVSPQRAKQILDFCTDKFREDPQVLTSSYFIATTMGWEDNKEVSEWLGKAIVLSNDDGPLHRASLSDLKEMLIKDRQKNEKVFKAYFNGEAPISLVAELLNRTISYFYLIQPLENNGSTDIRMKKLVPAFHGLRVSQVIVCETIALDASSALVMENVGLLNNLLHCFKKTIIPHSFMRWIFEEKQKVSFHQPSQIERAKYFEQLVADDKIFVLPLKKVNNPGLAIDVGDELASMLEEADASTNNEEQVLVACSCPVNKVDASLKEVEVDLSHYNNFLISCLQLIKKLKDMAVITDAQCLKAIGSLPQKDQDWPADIEIRSGAKIYLDSLSVSYLMTVGLLDKLSEAGFKVYVCKEERNRHRALIKYDLIIKQAELKIENIRKVFSDGLASGRVALAEMPMHGESVASTKNNYARPAEEIFEAIKLCDAALIDDRFMNKNKIISLGKKSVPIFTTLDFIETLYNKELISREQKFDARASLRELGFEFVSVTSEELEYHLNNSVMVDAEFKPNKQLRLIKENLLLIRISGLVQLPQDGQWLLETLGTISKVLIAQWSISNDTKLSQSRSCWLYELMGYREWAQAHNIRDEEGVAFNGEVLRINSILIAPEGIPPERQGDYKAWLDEFVLAPLKDCDPLSFKCVVDSVKRQVGSIVQQSISEERLDA